jgi:hypothetical protein
MPTDHSEMFRTTVLDPESWKCSARALIEAALVLEPKIDKFWQEARAGNDWDDGAVAIYFMLFSFALENLLKSRIIENKRSDLANALGSGTNLPETLKGHDLHKLMRDAGLRDSAKDEESLLHRLTRSAVWYGRYPVPVEASKLGHFKESEYEDFPISLTQYTSADRGDIKRLCRVLGATFP